ncbi:hypothetical protein L9F63_011616, partial [Diploptera punctata]
SIINLPSLSAFIDLIPTFSCYKWSMMSNRPNKASVTCHIIVNLFSFLDLLSQNTNHSSNLDLIKTVSLLRSAANSGRKRGRRIRCGPEKAYIIMSQYGRENFAQSSLIRTFRLFTIILLDSSSSSMSSRLTEFNRQLFRYQINNFYIIPDVDASILTNLKQYGLQEVIHPSHSLYRFFSLKFNMLQHFRYTFYDKELRSYVHETLLIDDFLPVHRVFMVSRKHYIGKLMLTEQIILDLFVWTQIIGTAILKIIQPITAL